MNHVDIAPSQNGYTTYGRFRSIKKKTQYFEKDPVHFSIIKINMESHPKKHTKVVCIYLCDIYVAKITQNSLPLSKEV